MEDELSHYQDHKNEDDLSESEIEESKHDHPQKRKQNFWTLVFQYTLTQTASTNNVLVVSHTDAGAIEKLKEIKRSDLLLAVLSLELQSVCA